ncbi:hypothetical protein [Amycolatopsis kentuckyensis]|uniref:hypothetical protein n=1 Tax=Amycolatopsis kentuckyensis TaxID=218823 RepID=UPI0035698575
MSTTAKWEPADAEKTHRTPQIGDTIAWDRRVWIVQAITPVPAEEWRESDHAMVDVHGPDATPSLITIRPATGDGEGVRLRTWAGVVAWWIYPHGHYAVCGCCHEPMPCLAQEADRAAELAYARALRFAEPGCCPECGDVVTANQRPIQFPENRVWPLGPAPVFHGNRRACRLAAEHYARDTATSASPKGAHQR